MGAVYLQPAHHLLGVLQVFHQYTEHGAKHARPVLQANATEYSLGAHTCSATSEYSIPGIGKTPSLAGLAGDVELERTKITTH